VYLGSKGIAHGRIRVAGGDWGGPAREIHSSNAPWIANPAWHLVAALSRFAPSGSLGDVPLPDSARPVLHRLAETFDADAELQFRNSARYSIGGHTIDRLQAVLTATSLNLAHLATEPRDGRAVIPSAAEARFDLRLPPGADPHAVVNAVRAAMPPEVELFLEDAYPGHYFGADSPAVAGLLTAYRDAGVEPQIWPWSIGAMPSYAFARIAGGLVIGGLGRGGNAHGVNEFVTLAGIDRFIASLLTWLPAAARRP
jgi:acetylornithine deacetylase/succinyl-diaminopimelate desuccinylase-like protein